MDRVTRVSPFHLQRLKGIYLEAIFRAKLIKCLQQEQKSRWALTLIYRNGSYDMPKKVSFKTEQGNSNAFGTRVVMLQQN